MRRSAIIEDKQNLFLDISLTLLELSNRRILQREVSLYLSVMSQDVIDVLTVADLVRIRARLDAWLLDTAPVLRDRGTAGFK